LASYLSALECVKCIGCKEKYDEVDASETCSEYHDTVLNFKY